MSSLAGPSDTNHKNEGGGVTEARDLEASTVHFRCSCDLVYRRGGLPASASFALSASRFA
jgi:hypothetical protein